MQQPEGLATGEPTELSEVARSLGEVRRMLEGVEATVLASVAESLAGTVSQQSDHDPIESTGNVASVKVHTEKSLPSFRCLAHRRRVRRVPVRR